jgi:tetratricopeptide (TPR) repeat protein
MKPIRLFAIFALLLGLGQAPRAHADAGPDRAKAKAFYDSGMAHYNLSEYKEALADFKEAYRIHHDPALLFNIAQCYRQLGEPAAAANFYRAYRRESPDSNRADVDRLIREMDRAVQEERARQPPTGTQPPEEHRTTTREPSPAEAQPAPPAQPSASSTLVATAPHASERPLAKKPWLWGVVVGGAVVVAGAVVLGVVLGSPAHDPVPSAGRVDGN